MYIDAMQSVLSKTTKIMIDIDSGNNLMMLPLDQIMGRGSEADQNRYKSNGLRIKGDSDEQK